MFLGIYSTISFFLSTLGCIWKKELRYTSLKKVKNNWLISISCKMSRGIRQEFIILAMVYFNSRNFSIEIK